MLLIGELCLWHLEVWHKQFYEMLNQSIPLILALVNSTGNPPTSTLRASDTTLPPRKCSSERAREISSPLPTFRSFRRFDTVTGNKVRSCKQMRGLLPSC